MRKTCLPFRMNLPRRSPRRSRAQFPSQYIGFAGGNPGVGAIDGGQRRGSHSGHRQYRCATRWPEFRLFFAEQSLAAYPGGMPRSWAGATRGTRGLSGDRCDDRHARRRFGDKPDEFFPKPTDIVAEVFHIAHQPRSASSILVEIRPFGEKW